MIFKGNVMTRVDRSKHVLRFISSLSEEPAQALGDLFKWRLGAQTD